VFGEDAHEYAMVAASQAAHGHGIVRSGSPANGRARLGGCV
jgi:hypothetical protein